MRKIKKTPENIKQRLWEREKNGNKKKRNDKRNKEEKIKIRKQKSITNQEACESEIDREGDVRKYVKHKLKN